MAQLSGLTARVPYTEKRSRYVEVEDLLQDSQYEPKKELIDCLEKYDLIYRTVCGILYNFVPTSGHPGGSISSGRMVEMLLFSTMDYDFSNPEREDADIISYAAGHKAMGLYAMWALRNEIARIARPELLADEKRQLRLEDLLGFRRNPTTKTPLFKKYHAKPLDGHPTPATPFIKIATGASGVGIPASFGLALGCIETYRDAVPFVHVIEGEGGMTPGRVSEALATAATAQLWNTVVHLDWNQASIDSNQVCRDGDKPGEYVQWNPMEFFYVHDWNVVHVPDGKDLKQVFAAQKYAASLDNGQPTAIVYRTVKGWKYGIEGKASHGAGHKCCSPEYYTSVQEFEDTFGVTFPRLQGEASPDNLEQNFFDTLMVVRKVFEQNKQLTQTLGAMLAESKERLDKKKRKLRPDLPDISAIYAADVKPEVTPDELVLKPGSESTLRAALGDTLNYLNKKSKGAIFGGAADLLGSTSISNLAKGFPQSFYNAVSNPGARLIACGGICEDCMGAFMAGLSAYGRHMGTGSSYGAFIAPLQHIASRLHGIGQQAMAEVLHQPYRPFILICAHAGLMTGEDGPTHADPQALQVLEENFPKGIMITLTPWDPAELWPLVVAGLKHRPAILAPFVTRPNVPILDRKQFKLPEAAASVKGVYPFRLADKKSKQYNGTVFIQDSGVANEFVTEVLPKLDKAGYNMNIYYVSSSELFSLLPDAEQDKLCPEEHRREAMGITGFTLPTMYKWVTSEEGRRRTLHAFRKGGFKGSGPGIKVMEEAGLHGDGQFEGIADYAKAIEKRR
ncbi:MAG: hypothetical protein QME66_02625 [Candidatus Eisenbacteria bacterium]|nr:hypothetical protein [Candidatus Eisenbacteria bacterium]